MSVREDATPGTVIFRVIATDRDAGQNGTVVYEIIGGNEQGKTGKKVKIMCSE